MERFKHIDNHKLENAKLFGDRFSAIDYVVVNNARYLEVGAGDGHYSQHVIDKKHPRLVHLIDFFHTPDYAHGKYDAAGHRSFIENRFKDQNLSTFKGHSKDVMPMLLGNEYDYIYIDASHDYSGVLDEVRLASQLCALDGVIGINDYTYYSPHDGEFYEVIEAVNTFLYENPEWNVLAFQLGHLGYSDIYITRNHSGLGEKSLNLHH